MDGREKRTKWKIFIGISKVEEIVNLLWMWDFLWPDFVSSLFVYLSSVFGSSHETHQDVFSSSFFHCSYLLIIVLHLFFSVFLKWLLNCFSTLPFEKNKIKIELSSFVGWMKFLVRLGKFLDFFWMELNEDHLNLPFNA